MVDCVIGGSPCQDLSVAGKRAGLAGERSGLYMEQIRIIKEMRHHDALRGRANESVRPRYMVWENVPGAFSSNQGKDFSAVLEEAIRVAEPEAPDVPVPEKGWPTSGCIVGDCWSVAWRVLDAQFWGVPQRRRRICLVADFNGLNAPKIVFGEAEYNGSTEQAGRKSPIGYSGKKPQSEVQPFAKGLSGDLDKSEQKGEAVTGEVKSRSGTDDRTRPAGFPLGFRPENVRCYDEVATTLCNGTRPGFTTGIIQPIAFDTYNMDVPGDKTVTLRAGAEHNYAPVFQPVIGIDQQGGKGGANYSVDVAPPLLSDSHGTPHAVAYSIENHPAEDTLLIEMQSTKNTIVTDGVCPTLTARMGTGGNQVNAVMDTYQSVTGPLMANSHPGSYTGQDAYSDMLIAGPVGTFQETGIGWWNDEDVGATLRALSGGDAMKANLVVAGVDCRNATEYEEQTGSLQFSSCHNLNSNNVVRVRYIVRRLTPLECERLQGYMDGWTLLPQIEDMTVDEYEFWKHALLERAMREGRARANEVGLIEVWQFVDGDVDEDGEWINTHKPYKHKTKAQMVSWYNRMIEADSSRYKALGNSIAIPPWKWVLKRLCAFYERDATMASLFDGIGGFPYIWEQLNGKGSCLWASEIEEFPMAVTRLRFGGDGNV